MNDVDSASAVRLGRWRAAVEPSGGERESPHRFAFRKKSPCGDSGAVAYGTGGAVHADRRAGDSRDVGSDLEGIANVFSFELTRK